MTGGLQRLGLMGSFVTGNDTAAGDAEHAKNPAATEVEEGQELPESGRPDSNRRRPAWEAGILPLNYARRIALQRLTCFRPEEYVRKRLAHQALFDTGWLQLGEEVGDHRVTSSAVQMSLSRWASVKYRRSLLAAK